MGVSRGIYLSLCGSGGDGRRSLTASWGLTPDRGWTLGRGRKQGKQTAGGGVAQEGWTGMRQGGGAVSWCVGAGCATSPWLRNQIALLFVFQACGLEGACSYRAQVCPSLASVCGLCRYWASRPCALVTPMEASGGSYTVPEDTAPAMPRSRAVGASRRCASVCDSGETCVRHWLLLLQSPS